MYTQSVEGRQGPRETTSEGTEPLRLEPGSSANSAGGGPTASWSACAKVIQEYDAERVKMWKEDIDTMLVFAGLFSAVVTTFSSQSSMLLQSDSQASSLLVLQEIFYQLRTPNVVDRHTGPTPQLTPTKLANSSTNFQPPRYAVRLNILWFSSLVCSLVAALIGILAKQWLREYLSDGSSSPRETVRLRQHRYNGLIRWGIPEILTVLPLLLEISLVLFLIGLVEFLLHLHPLVAGVISALVGVSLIFYLGTSILPAFSADCPYKSPQSWVIVLLHGKTINLFDALSSRLYGGRTRSTVSPRSPTALPADWRERDFRSLWGRRNVLDGSALDWCCNATSNDDILDSIIPAVQDLRPEIAVDLVFETLARIADSRPSVLVENIRSSTSGPISDLLMLVGGSRGTARLIQMLLYVLPKVPHNTNSFDINVLDTISILRQLLLGSSQAFCEDPLHRQALVSLTELVNPWEPVNAQRAVLGLLWELTTSGCNNAFCPDAIGNIFTCAREAFDRGDEDMFCTACAIALVRLPALDLSAHDYEWFRRTWLQDWLLNLERYFRHRNHHKLPYDVQIPVRWCSGLHTLASNDRALVTPNLIKAIDEGVKLGLTCHEPEEMDIWKNMRVMYRHILSPSALELESASRQLSDTMKPR